MDSPGHCAQKFRRSTLCLETPPDRQWTTADMIWSHHSVRPMTRSA
jgi:hypothetical protein